MAVLIGAASVEPDLSTWSTYRNARYCYRIRYPEEAEPPDRDSVATFVLTRADKVGNTVAFGFDIWVRSNPRRLSVRDWVRDEEAARKASGVRRSLHDRVLERKAMRVAGSPALRLRLDDNDHGRDVIYVARDTLVYVLMFPLPVAGIVEPQSLTQTFEHMLSTFEFAGDTCRSDRAP